MSSKFVGYGLKAIKNLIKGGKQKTTGTEVVQPFKFKPAKNKVQKVVKEFKIDTIKSKGKTNKIIQKMESEIEPFRRKLRQTTQKLAGEKVTESGISKGKDRIKKMGGGMMGRRMGYSEGSSKGKVPTTPKEKSLAKLAPPKDRITFGDVVAGRKKGKA